MPLPDIRVAGVLAGINLWGWPYHGLCSAGTITLPNSSTKEIAPPTHGAAWLYDMGLPAVTRSPAQSLGDADLGHQWLNYAFVSGGVLYGVQLGDNSFIYVDPDGDRWLITMTATAPDISAQRVRLAFTVVKFGVISENGEAGAIAATVLNVQCTQIAYTSMAGANYSSTPIYLEDVWTNGQRALIGVYRSDGFVADMYSLIELTLSGAGGEIGSGVVIEAAEIRADADLTYSHSTAELFDPGESVTVPFSDTGTDCDRIVTWGPWSGPLWVADVGMPGTLDVQDTDRDITTSFARVAHYDAAGMAHVYRLVSGYRQQYAYAGFDSDYAGSEQYCGQIAGTNPIESDAHATGSTSITLVIEYGLSLMRDDQVVDSVKFAQSADGAQLFFKSYTASSQAIYVGPDPVASEPPTPDGYISSPWGSVNTTFSKQIMRFTAPVLTGSLAASLSITPPAFSGSQSFGYTAPPLSESAMTAIYTSWRAGTRHYSSGSAVIADSATVGIQRIDSKAVSFYADDAGARTYGSIHTPTGALPAGETASSNLYFAWNRKTGQTAISTSPICYV